MEIKPVPMYSIICSVSSLHGHVDLNATAAYVQLFRPTPYRVRAERESFKKLRNTQTVEITRRVMLLTLNPNPRKPLPLKPTAGQHQQLAADTETAYTSLSCPALLFDWLITLTLTLTIFDTIILDQSAGSNSGVYVDFYNADQ